MVLESEQVDVDTKHYTFVVTMVPSIVQTLFFYVLACIHT